MRERVARRYDTGWLKSIRSTTAGSECVEVRLTESGVWVRDSKDREGPVLDFGSAAWSRFVLRLKEN
jgi:Domain of unknown function (DUF397)